VSDSADDHECHEYGFAALHNQGSGQRTILGRCGWSCRPDRAVNVRFGISVSIPGVPKLGGAVGLLSRLLVPRSVRRAMHPVRSMKRAATPKVVRKAGRALHPADNIVYGAEREVITSLRSGRKRRRKGRAPVYRHGSCPVAHRSREAAAKCRNR
jgi:hypothetical protein